MNLSVNSDKHRPARLAPALVSALTLITLVFCSAARVSALPPRAVARAADQAQLRQVARQLPVRGVLRVEGIPFEGTTVALDLERFEQFTPDAQVVISSDQGETVVSPPDNAYFRGSVTGDIGAVALLTAPEQGAVRGLIFKDGVPWVIAEEDDPMRSPGLKTRRVDLARDFAGRTFTCGTDNLPSAAALSSGAISTQSFATASEALIAAASISYTARVAVETDYEFFRLFGSTTTAANYVGDLFAYASTIYGNEVNTSLAVSYLKLYTTSADPWNATSSGAALTELANYWKTNNSGINRTITHMLSGKALGGGIAYIGALCNNSVGYGVSGNLAGTFNITNPGVVWDIVVVSHEIGHNFNSPHTHCYGGIGGSSSPVDKCWGSESGCYTGATSLPCSLGPGNKCGTIMSYCHQQSGGLSNISLSFGLGFPYGVLPGRVPTRMHDFVVANASCLQPTDSHPNLSLPSSGLSRKNLRALHSGKCADVRGVSLVNGAAVQQWDCLGSGQLNQLWNIVPVGTGVFQVVSVNSGKCLDVTGVSHNNGAPIQQYTCLGANQRNQLWRFQFLSTVNRYQVVSVESGKCLDVTGVSTANGAPFQQYDCLGSTQRNQLFSITNP